MADSARGQRVRELLETVAAALGAPARVELDEGEGRLRAELVGEDLGVVIGRHGQTIDALQHLARRVAGPGERVEVDAAGYRERRAAGLRRQGDEAADRACRLGRAIAMDAMPAWERRVIHEHLRERGDVETHSEGEEPRRRLVVEPAPG